MELKSLFIVLLSFAGSTALAEPAPAEDDRAKQLYFDAERLYAGGEYTKAAQLFEEAHRLSGRPELLFNMANAYERALDFEKAANALERYLQEGRPRANAAESVRQRLTHLRARAEQAKQRDEELAKLRKQREEEEAQKKIVVAPPPPPPSMSSMSIAGWSMVGVGGAAIVTGVVLAVLAGSAGSEARDACNEVGGARLCLSSARGSLDREESLALGTDISFGIGISAAIAATILLIMGGADAQSNSF